MNILYGPDEFLISGMYCRQNLTQKQTQKFVIIKSITAQYSLFWSYIHHTRTWFQWKSHMFVLLTTTKGWTSILFCILDRSLNSNW